MSHITKEEYLSAFVDGEAGSFEQHRICDELTTDDAMREKLASFALIGETIRNRSQSEVEVASPSFLSGIQDAIADDEPYQSIQNDDTVVSLDAIRAKKKRIFPKQAVGYAVAASVAAVAAISFQNYTNSFDKSQPQLASTATVQQPVNQSSLIAVMPSVKIAAEKATNAVAKKAAVKEDYLLATSFRAPDAQMKGMMDKYVAHHLQYASSSTLMPRVRAVSYSTDF